MTRYSYIGSEMDEPDMFTIHQSEIAIYSRPSPYKDGNNEDCAAIIDVDENTILLIVADGLGGHSNGAAASSLMIETFGQKFYEHSHSQLSVRERILDSIESTNSVLMDKANGGYTTVAVAEIHEHNLRTYHVGDSEILLAGQRGKLKLRTISHSPVGYAVESEWLNEDEAMMDGNRHYISNTLGQNDMYIAMSSWLKMGKRDTLLIGTDGLFDNLLENEIINYVRKGALGTCAQNISDAIMTRMQTAQSGNPSKPDDATFILYRMAN